MTARDEVGAAALPKNEDCEDAQRHELLPGALRRAVEELRARQTPEALWRNACVGGPLHTAMGLIATSLLGEPDSRRFQAEGALLRDLLASQAEGGGFVDYPGGEPARSSTRIALLALQVFRAHNEAALAMAPDLNDALESASRRATNFLESSARGGAGFFKVVADLLWDTVYPADSRTLPAIPFMADAAGALVESPRLGLVRNGVSVFVTEAMPAMTILFAKAAARSRWTNACEALGVRVGYPGPARALRALEARLLAHQDPGGSWLWSVMGTSLNLLALRAMGRGPDDPAVQRGVRFIERMRMQGTDGRLRQSWCNAENWDAALACDTLLTAGVSPAQIRLDAVVDHLLREQRPDALWGFGVGARQGDNDTGALVMAFLAKAAKRVDSSRRAAVGVALSAATCALLRAQQRDGGWGFSPAPCRAPYSFRRRVPFGPEANVIDASTADVTARAITALLASRATGLLDADTSSRAGAAVASAVGFLKRSQTRNGSWWGRWRPGYLSSLTFLMPALCASGQDMSAGWIRRARTFVVDRQNADGGWGETTAADWHPTMAGRGSSTPLQTASAVFALVASATDRRALDGVDLRRAITFLAEGQARGPWDNGRACYTAAFREDYWDSPLGTHTMVTRSLAYYALAVERGVQAATQTLVCGESQNRAHPERSPSAIRAHRDRLPGAL